MAAMLTVELSRPPEVLVSRPKAVLGKKPPWSAPVGPPSPDSVNSMIARPPLLGVAAMAGMSRSSCLGETYPWLVRVNLPVVSNERVPTTQYTAPMWISALALVYVWAIWVLVAAQSWPCACETCVRLSPLVASPPSGQEAGGGEPTLSPACPHSSPSGIGPVFCGAKIPPVLTVSGS